MRFATLATIIASACLASCKDSKSQSSIPSDGKHVSQAVSMPVTEANCDALWKELIEVKKNTVASIESFQGESMVKIGFTALENLGYNPDTTIRSLAFLASYGSRSCVNLIYLIPNNLPAAVEKGLISLDTQRVFEERAKFPKWSESGLGFVTAIDQCERDVSSPCTLSEVVPYLKGDVAKRLAKAIETNDSQLFTLAVWNLGCDDKEVMKMVLSGDEGPLTCKGLEPSSELGVNKDVRDRMLSARVESEAYLDAQKQALGVP